MSVDPMADIILTEEDHARMRAALGCRVHLHDGVWWETAAPFHVKPAFEFRTLRPGEARPARLRSLLGYSHQVPEGGASSRTLEFMILDGAGLAGFSMAALRSEKRNQVRKGLKSCEVRRIADLAPVLEEARLINISQAERQAGDETVGAAVSYYTTRAEAWRADQMKLFGLGGTEWWGAFVDGHMAAYMITSRVESVFFVQVMKTHSDHLKACLTDATYFTVLSRAAESRRCTLVVNGGPAREGLNRFKEQFLFRRVAVPYFTAGAGLHATAKAVWNRMRRARAAAFRLAGRTAHA